MDALSCEPGYSGVLVEAGARLHMGFINPTPGQGRSFGSMGVALQSPSTRIGLRTSAAPRATGPDAERALLAVHRTAQILGVQPRAQVTVHQSIPEHTGLGSGTQLALSVGWGLARVHAHAATLHQIAAVTERGARSGIGIGAFEQGGFLLDGGRGSSDRVPPVIARMPFPDRWRIILVLDPATRGLHGQQEIDAFRTLPAFPPDQVAYLAQLVLTEVLPALAEQQLDAFGAAITEIQERVGDHFAPAQGGRFASPIVAQALEYLRGGGGAAIGQSSWGPTGFCVVPGEQQAQRLVADARRRFARSADVRFVVTRARNTGASIHTDKAGAPAATIRHGFESQR